MKAFKPAGFDKALLAAVLVLLGVGFIMVFSSSAVMSGKNSISRCTFSSSR